MYTPKKIDSCVSSSISRYYIYDDLEPTNFHNFCFTAVARAAVVQAVAAVTEVVTPVSIVGGQLGQHQELP
jgi:hypothetical protein